MNRQRPPPFSRPFSFFLLAHPLGARFLSPCFLSLSFPCVSPNISAPRTLPARPQRRRALLWRPRLSPLHPSLSPANPRPAPRRPPPPRSAIPTSTSYCEQEFYVQYNDVAGTQTLRTLRNIASAGDCCNACQGDPFCRHMTYNVVTSECKLFKGPSSTQGWGRKAWQYAYVSGLVSRR